MNVDVGAIVDGKYELVRLLGHGAMGEVWVAHHRSLGQKVAIKFLVPDGEAEPEETARRRFLFEAQVAAKLSQRTRHVVSVIDHGEEQGSAYLVMELLEGETLEARLARVERLAPTDVVEIVTQISRGLASAHGEALFHRDLKPANVFCSKDEHGQLLVKLLDFGIAGSVRRPADGASRTTAKGMVLGSPSYMSPEQVMGSAKLDHGCDLWALAVVAYEALSGRLPFPGGTPQETFVNICAAELEPVRALRPELPLAIDDFFARAFARNAGDRFQSATALADALARAAPGDLHGMSRTTSPHGALAGRRGGNGAALGVAAVIVALAVVGAATLLRTAGKDSTRASAQANAQPVAPATSPPTPSTTPLPSPGPGGAGATEITVAQEPSPSPPHAAAPPRAASPLARVAPPLPATQSSPVLPPAPATPDATASVPAIRTTGAGRDEVF